MLSTPPRSGASLAGPVNSPFDLQADYSPTQQVRTPSKSDIAERCWTRRRLPPGSAASNEAGKLVPPPGPGSVDRGYPWVLVKINSRWRLWSHFVCDRWIWPVLRQRGRRSVVFERASGRLATLTLRDHSCCCRCRLWCRQGFALHSVAARLQSASGLFCPPLSGA